ncbi:MAG: GNAT family N-acetyltransferase [Draconibacterium sp.]
MEHIRVNETIRLEKVKVSMAGIIFSTLDKDRDYLKTWLPFVELTHKVSDTEKFLKQVVKDTETRKNEVFSIWYNEEFAGLIGFNDIDWINRKTEIGYWLAEKMQGKGIITLCTEKLIHYGFQKLKLNRIQIKVAIGNTKSESIPKRLGFIFEGVERGGEFHHNKYLDLQIFSILKSDIIIE